MKTPSYSKHHPARLLPFLLLFVALAGTVQGNTWSASEENKFALTVTEDAQGKVTAAYLKVYFNDGWLSSQNYTFNANDITQSGSSFLAQKEIGVFNSAGDRLDFYEISGTFQSNGSLVGTWKSSYYHAPSGMTPRTNTKEGGFTSTNGGSSVPDLPANVSASDGTYTDKVRITWNSVSGASYYRVYRATSSSGTKTAISSWQTALSFDDTTAVPGTTYYYFVQAASSSSGANASGYSSYNDGYRDQASSGGSLLHEESFESGLGIWVSDTSTFPMTWTRHSGETPSTGTGPISASDGSYYLYMEASSKTAGDSAALYARIDLSSAVSPELRFDYHMYGAGMGVLAVYANDGVETLNLWNVAGEQHSSGSSSWSEGVVDLSTYAGNSSFTIFIVGAIGPDFTSDIAVDNIRISDQASSSPNPSAPTGVSATDGMYDDKVHVTWNSVLGATHYRVYRATSSSGTKTAISSWQTALSFDDTTAVPGTTYYYFVQAASSSSGANASGYSSYNDGYRDQASSGGSLLHEESFESGLGIWVSDTSTFPMTWTRHSGETPSTGTGPISASDGSYYMYMEASNKTAGDSAVLYARIDLSSAVSPELRFDYHMYGAGMGLLAVYANDGVETLNLWNVAGEQHSSGSSSWSEGVVDLSAYAGNSSFTIFIVGAIGPDFTSDIAVDNIRISDQASDPYDTWKSTSFSGSGYSAKQMERDADPDGDGQSNLQEYIFGTDPTHAQDARVLDCRVLGGEINLDVRSLDDRFYVIEGTDDLTSSNWVEVTSFQGTGTNMFIIDPNSMEHHFYRLKAEVLSE